MNPLSYFLEYNRYHSFLGIIVILGLAVLMSNNQETYSLAIGIYRSFDAFSISISCS